MTSSNSRSHGIRGTHYRSSSPSSQDANLRHINTTSAATPASGESIPLQQRDRTNAPAVRPAFGMSTPPRRQLQLSANQNRPNGEADFWQINKQSPQRRGRLSTDLTTSPTARLASGRSHTYPAATLASSESIVPLWQG
ncbi:hypothetical protein CRG98_020622 [Punica granatum]|uniref:Uncharacterized protein n=1 Tax=Punica granatum TaxID=22663 RepID=A0A2I0JRN5_PUNGR|nr:hypothetical protein CRG98_020622 [Punica granatum]